jgi:hypothetical protein
MALPPFIFTVNVTDFKLSEPAVAEAVTNMSEDTSTSVPVILSPVIVRVAVGFTASSSSPPQEDKNAIAATGNNIIQEFNFIRFIFELVLWLQIP